MVNPCLGSEIVDKPSLARAPKAADSTTLLLFSKEQRWTLRVCVSVCVCRVRRAAVSHLRPRPEGIGIGPAHATSKGTKQANRGHDRGHRLALQNRGAARNVPLIVNNHITITTETTVP